MQMIEVCTLNRDAAKLQPESVFESPLEIVNEILLTKGEKLATLNRWRRSILGELAASNEGARLRERAAHGLVIRGDRASKGGPDEPPGTENAKLKKGSRYFGARHNPRLIGGRV
jgi:hypothetical protein